MAFGLKYYMPLLLLAGAILLAGPNFLQYPQRLSLMLPLIFFAVFLITAAEVRLREDRLEYRRFRKWHSMRYSEITDCRLSVWRLLGWLKLKHPLRPWNRLYIIAGAPYPSNPQVVIDIINNRTR